MQLAVKKITILESAKHELTQHGHPTDPETLYYFLCGMQDAWTEDTSDDDDEEKFEYLAALRAVIHDQLHAMESA